MKDYKFSEGHNDFMTLQLLGWLPLFLGAVFGGTIGGAIRSKDWSDTTILQISISITLHLLIAFLLIRFQPRWIRVRKKILVTTWHGIFLLGAIATPLIWLLA